MHKSDSRPFEYNDYALDAAVPKSDEIGKKNHKVILYDLKGHERDAHLLPFEMDSEDRLGNMSEIDCNINADDMVNGCGNEVRNSVSTCAISSEKLESLEKDGDLFADKSVTKHELPVCCKESTYHIVKDICIDEGMLSEEKILVESGKECVDSQQLHTDKNVDPTKEIADKKQPLPDGQKALAENHCCKDDDNLCSLRDLMQAEEYHGARDKITSDASEVKLVQEDIFLIPQLSDENPLPKSSEFNGMEIEQQCMQVHLAKCFFEVP